ncbi:MAG: PspC domain-containing protein [Anaerolineales bacterium]|jgi:phage shock protein C
MSEDVKRLYRSETDRWLLGVCGGIAEYFNLDPIIIRILFIIFAMVFGGGILLYLILWLIIPMRPPEIVKSEELEGE